MVSPLIGVFQLINRSINIFYSFIAFSLIIKNDILVLDCLVLIVSLHVFLFINSYFSFKLLSLSILRYSFSSI